MNVVCVWHIFVCNFWIQDKFFVCLFFYRLSCYHQRIHPPSKNRWDAHIAIWHWAPKTMLRSGGYMYSHPFEWCNSNRWVCFCLCECVLANRLVGWIVWINNWSCTFSLIWWSTYILNNSCLVKIPLHICCYFFSTAKPIKLVNKYHTVSRWVHMWL